MIDVAELEKIILEKASVFSFAFNDDIINTLFSEGINNYLSLEDDELNKVIFSHLIKYFENEFKNNQLPVLFNKYLISRNKSSVDATNFVLFDELLEKIENYELSFDDVASIINNTNVKKYLEKDISQDILNANNFLNQIHDFYEMSIDEEKELDEGKNQQDLSSITNDNYKLYRYDCSFYKLLTLEEEKMYTIKYYETKDPEAFEMLVGCNQGLVVAVAKKYQNRGLSLLDLIQEGNIGLLSAIPKYNPYLGWRFSTYVMWWIRQAVVRAIHEKSRAIKVPVHMSERFNKLSKIEAILFQELCREPTEEEILEMWNKQVKTDKDLMTIDKIREMRIYRDTITPTSLNKEVNDGERDDSSLQDFIANVTVENPADYVERLETIALWNKALDELKAFSTPEKNKRAAQMIRMYKGIFDKTTEKILREASKPTEERKMILTEIGEVFGISGERVRQIIEKAKRSLEITLNSYENPNKQLYKKKNKK